MKRLLVLIALISFGLSSFASSSAKRQLFEHITLEEVKDLIQDKGIQEFLIALKSRALPDEVYDLPLHTLTFVGITNKEISLGAILEQLNNDDAAEKAVMASFFSRGGRDYLKDRVIVLARKGHLIDALKKKTLPDAVYDHPLHTYKVKKDKKRISVAKILASTLKETDPEEKRVLGAFFSRGGKAYVEKILSDIPGLQELSQFVAAYPFVMDHVNPFDVVWKAGLSIGYWVEKTSFDGGTHARAIKDAYIRRNDLWKAYVEAATKSGNPEIKILEDYAQTKTTFAQMDNLVQLGGFARLKEAFVKIELHDCAYDRDLESMVVSANGVSVSVGSLLKEQVTKNDAHALALYRKYLLRGGRKQLEALMVKAKTSQDLTEFAQEVGYCPEIALCDRINLFHPECGLGMLIEECCANGSSPQRTNAQKIKAAYTPLKWARDKEFCKNANTLYDCLRNITLTAQGIAVLKAYKATTNREDDELVQSSIASIKRQLARQIQIALAGTDAQEIKTLEAWLRGFDEAGVELGGVTNSAYQTQLKNRKEEIVRLSSNGVKKDPKATPAASEKPTSWLTFRKGLVLIAAGLTLTYLYDKLQNAPDEKPQRKVVLPVQVS